MTDRNFRPRGFSCVALHKPKTPANVGAVCRAASVYNVALLVLTGTRFRRAPTDVTKAYRHLPLVRSESVFDALPFDCVPIAVDLLDGAKPLPDFTHPERAFYIFGPEDGTLGKQIHDQCAHKIYVPGESCMNLAAAVNVVLYDRLAKQWRQKA